MKRFFILLLGCCLSFSVSASDATFDFSNQGYTNAQHVDSGVIDAKYNTVWQAIGGQPNAAYYTSGSALRVYRGSVFKVTSNKAMAKISLTLGSDTQFDEDAVQEPNDTVFSWTYTAESGHVRIQKIEVTYVDYWSVQEVMTEYQNLNLASGATSGNTYKVRGYVTKWNSGYPQHQNADFFIDDSATGSTSLLKCFRLTADNENDKRKLDVGEYIEAEAYLMNYNGQAELKSGTYHVVSSVTPPPPPVETTYTLSISAGEGGTVNSQVNGTYKEGTQVTISATADEGYVFSQWDDGNIENPRTVTMTQDITLRAEFEKEIICLHPELEGKKGDEILSILHDQIVNHTVLDYDNVRADRAKVDLRADGTIWDIYSSCSFNRSDYCSGDNYNTTVECECYNREHTLPISWWGSSKDEPMYTDLHHILPTDNVANEKRHAWAYGEVTEDPIWSNELGSKLGYGTFGHSGNNYVFEPVDEYKGDIARIYFYMITCYNDKNFTQGGKGYQMFSYSNGTAKFTTGALDFLLRWHRADEVSEKEKKRNDAVEQKQGNRNPFVDDPKLVEYIWGNLKSKEFSCEDEAIDIVQQTPSAIKVLRNGQILIFRGEKTYTVTGLEVR